MVHQTDSQERSSLRESTQGKGETIVQPLDNMNELDFKQTMDRISKHRESYCLLEDIRNTEDRKGEEPLSPENPFSPVSSSWEFIGEDNQEAADRGSIESPLSKIVFLPTLRDFIEEDIRKAEDRKSVEPTSLENPFSLASSSWEFIEEDNQEAADRRSIKSPSPKIPFSPASWDFIEEDIRKAEDGENVEPTSLENPFFLDSSYWGFIEEEMIGMEPPSPKRPSSPASSSWVLSSLNPVNNVPKADHTKPAVETDKWSSPDFGPWKPKVQTAVETKARYAKFQRLWDSSNSRARMDMERDSENTTLESYTHSCISEERMRFLDQSGLNKYQIKTTDRTRKLSEPGNVSPRTKPQDHSHDLFGIQLLNLGTSSGR